MQIVRFGAGVVVEEDEDVTFGFLGSSVSLATGLIAFGDDDFQIPFVTIQLIDVFYRHRSIYLRPFGDEE